MTGAEVEDFARRSQEALQRRFEPGAHESRRISQRNDALPYSDHNPSAVNAAVGWIYADRKQGEYPELTERSGKWLLFVASANIDDVWSTIKKAIEQGLLGYSSKVRTGSGKGSKVICVYTCDSDDAGGV